MKFQKAFGILGITAFLAFTAIALANYPSYDFARQFFSALGVGEKSAFWFNTGCIISGVLFAFFFAEFARKQKIPAILGIIAGIALAFVGLLPASLGVLHNASAFAFFTLSGLTALGFSLKNFKQEKTSAILGIAFFASVILLALFANPTMQKASVILFGVWVLSLLTLSKNTRTA